MASTDKPDADDKSDLAIEIDEGEQAKALIAREQTPGRTVDMDGEGEPTVSAKTPASTFDGVQYKRGEANWGDAKDGRLPALVPSKPPEEEQPKRERVESATDHIPEGIELVPDDLKTQKISKELVDVVQNGAAAKDEAALPELDPVKPAMKLVTNDEKTPPHGTEAPEFHTGLSLPDQEPVQEPVFQDEPAPSLPPVPGSRLMQLIESEDMNRKDEADPKTDAMELRSFRPAGMVLKSDALLLRSKTAKPFEKTVDELRRAKEKMMRAFDLKERRTMLLQEQWKRRDTKARLEELREKELAGRKAVEDEEAGLKKTLGDAKDKMKRHQSDAGSAQEMAAKQTEKMQGEFEKLNELAKLLKTLIEAAMKVRAVKAEPDVEPASVPGTEAMKSLTVLLNPLMDLPTTWSEFLSSRRLELQEKGAYNAILEEHKPLLVQFNRLKESKEPIDARIAEVNQAIAGVEGELDAIAGEIKGIDRELRELEPPEEPAQEEPQEET